MNLDIIVAYEIEAFSRQVRGSLPGNVLHIADVSSVGVYIIFIDLIVSFTSDTGSTATHMIDLDVTQRYLITVDDHILRFILGVIGNSNAITVHHSLARGDAGQTSQLICQFDSQFGIFTILFCFNTDVASRQRLPFSGFAFDTDLIVQFDRNRSIIRLIDITTIFHAIIHGSHIMYGA